jgi:hypothetical protein
MGAISLKYKEKNMGIFDKLKTKILGGIEKSAVGQMNDEEKAAYEAEKEANKQEVSTNTLSLKYTKEDTNDLEALLVKLGALDDRRIWVGGFLKLRTNTNAKFANMFSGHKNLKFLCVNGDNFYMVFFKDGVISSYKEFKKENVASVNKSPVLTVGLFDKTTMHLEVTKNKQKLNELILLLKAK